MGGDRLRTRRSPFDDLTDRLASMCHLAGGPSPGGAGEQGKTDDRDEGAEDEMDPAPGREVEEWSSPGSFPPALFTGATWARVGAMVLCALSIFVNFLWLPHYPAWAITIIALNAVVIWAVATWNPEVI